MSSPLGQEALSILAYAKPLTACRQRAREERKHQKGKQGNLKCTQSKEGITAGKACELREERASSTSGK